NKSEALILSKELQSILKVIEGLALAMQEQTNKHAEAKEKVSHILSDIDQLNVQVDAASSAAKGDATNLQEKETALQQALDQKRKCHHDLHVLDVKDKESEHQEMRLS